MLTNDERIYLNKNMNRKYNLCLEYKIDFINSVLYTSGLSIKKNSENNFNVSNYTGISVADKILGTERY